jgi:hypothetical protein
LPSQLCCFPSSRIVSFTSGAKAYPWRPSWPMMIVFQYLEHLFRRCVNLYRFDDVECGHRGFFVQFTQPRLKCKEELLWEARALERYFYPSDGFYVVGSSLKTTP